MSWLKQISFTNNTEIDPPFLLMMELFIYGVSFIRVIKSIYDTFTKFVLITQQASKMFFNVPLVVHKV
jgi:hypothetical protein